jgi:hypothetical protein
MIIYFCHKSYSSRDNRKNQMLYFQISTLNNLSVTRESLVWVFLVFLHLLQFIMMDIQEYTVQVILGLYPSLIKLSVLGRISVLTLIINYVLKISWKLYFHYQHIFFSRTKKSNFFLTDGFMLLYSTEVRSKVDYISNSWNCITVMNLSELQRIQRKLAALSQHIFNGRIFQHSAPGGSILMPHSSSVFLRTKSASHPFWILLVYGHPWG